MCCIAAKVLAYRCMSHTIHMHTTVQSDRGCDKYSPPWEFRPRNELQAIYNEVAKIEELMFPSVVAVQSMSRSTTTTHILYRSIPSNHVFKMLYRSGLLQWNPTGVFYRIPLPNYQIFFLFLVPRFVISPSQNARDLVFCIVLHVKLRKSRR